eukprot:g12786.t1
MHLYPQRASLQELGGEIFKLVSYGASSKQWAEWLRVPLEHGAARGDLDLVNTLLQAGADGSAGWRGCRGRTLLDAAAVGGNPDVVMALLGAGAQPDVNVVSLSPKRSALYVATICGHEEVARRLIQAGADVRFEDPVDQCSILHEAACDGRGQLVNDLLIAGADPNAFAKVYGMPLHQAASMGHDGVVSSLLRRGANVDALDHVGGTALMWAAVGGRLTAVKTLLAAGADFSIRDTRDCSVLDYAARQGYVPILKVILEHGADANSRDRRGSSALHKAALANKAGAIDALVEAGANVELESISGDTPLLAAAFFIDGESVLALLKRGADVTVSTTNGLTPLHRACFAKHAGLAVVVDLMLRWGADETAEANNRKTPADLLDLAVSYGSRRSSREEVDRARLLLARAPADRAWRRRGWLVMLRSRASKSRLAGHGGDADGFITNLVAVETPDGSGRGKACKTARTDGSDSVPSGGHGQICSTPGGDATGEESERWDLKGLVARLLELELEGVFRTVVGYI